MNPTSPSLKEELSQRLDALVQEDRSKPRYELRATQLSSMDRALEIWQLPSPATPHLKRPKRVAGLKKRNLALIEPRLLRQLRALEIDFSGLKQGEGKRFDLDEENALRMGLLFRTLAPMRNRDKMRSCTEGIEAMGKEEASYWLGMAMYRKNPQRVLMALRCLLTDPKRN